MSVNFNDFKINQKYCTHARSFRKGHLLIFVKSTEKSKEQKYHPVLLIKFLISFSILMFFLFKIYTLHQTAVAIKKLKFTLEINDVLRTSTDFWKTYIYIYPKIAYSVKLLGYWAGHYDTTEYSFPYWCIIQQTFPLQHSNLHRWLHRHFIPVFRGTCILSRAFA